MSTYLSDDYLLHSDLARDLYFNEAAPQPIIDYHCHLPPDQIAANYQFRNLYDAWLAGDHYKWRAMRSNGIPESHVTGDASDYDKFLAYARTVPYTLRNPLYDWTHLELKRSFGITTPLNEDTAPAIWEQANAQLAEPTHTTRGFLTADRVAVVGTTDDPLDPLTGHAQCNSDANFSTRVYPTYRPDKALKVNDNANWNAWVDQLAAITGNPCMEFADYVEALRQRHDFFHAAGGRLSDHALDHVPSGEGTEEEAMASFNAARDGEPVSAEDADKFASFMLVYFGRWAAAKDWTMQFHIGAQRNNSTRQFKALGPDTGFDSIADEPLARGLSTLLDRMDQTGELPKVVLYNLNPAANYALGTMIGNFQDGSVAGKIQFGSGWWFLDQRQGMQWQMNALSNLGLLRRFVGMLTDSRSFLSYSRHEYFRRLLCDMLGEDVRQGYLPNDRPLLAAMVREISYENARNYFGFTLHPEYASH